MVCPSPQEKRIIQQGWSAAESGVPMIGCPHKSGSDEALLWREGYDLWYANQIEFEDYHDWDA